MKQLIIFDLVAFILALIFGIFANTFQGLYFLTGLFIAISVISIIAFIIGLLCILFKILEQA